MDNQENLEEAQEFDLESILNEFGSGAQDSPEDTSEEAPEKAPESPVIPETPDTPHAPESADAPTDAPEEQESVTSDTVEFDLSQLMPF